MCQCCLEGASAISVAALLGRFLLCLLQLSQSLRLVWFLGWLSARSLGGRKLTARLMGLHAPAEDNTQLQS